MNIPCQVGLPSKPLIDCLNAIVLRKFLASIGPGDGALDKIRDDRDNFVDVTDSLVRSIAFPDGVEEL